MDMTDEQLIEQRQFGDLLERYRGCCYRRASQILRDPDLAEDTVQEAFVRAYRDLEAGRFRGVLALATWLYRIVSNAALTIREKEKRKPEAIGDEEEDWVERLLGVDPSLSPDESLILQELIGRVREAVALA
jgi:RNA polymerase sigma-70 factor (ECF subfamily)